MIRFRRWTVTSTSGTSTGSRTRGCRRATTSCGAATCRRTSRSHLERAGVSKTVVVQAQMTMAEADLLFDLAASADSIAGVVAWVDLTDENVGADARPDARDAEVRRCPAPGTRRAGRALAAPR